MAMRKPDEEIYVGGKLYLRRWWLRKPKEKPLRIYLHNMLISDDDRALHDHISDNLSIVLWGGYIEHVFERPPIDGVELPRIIQKRRRMGSIVYRKAELAHRLELYRGDGMQFDKVTTEKRLCLGPNGILLAGGDDWHVATPKVKPCWTLFITWGKRRDWGFWTERDGIVGETQWPTPDKVISLRSLGPVANWVHNVPFLSRRWRMGNDCS